MSNHKKRVDLIFSLLAGSNVSRYARRYNLITREFNEVYRSNKVQNNHRRWLTQILHSTRALDTSLSLLMHVYGRNPQNPSLGSYLYELTYCGKFDHSIRDHFQRSIVNVRNRYMHTAGEFPVSNNEVKNILSEIHQCLIKSL